MAGEESILRAEKIYENFPVKTNRHLTVRAVCEEEIGVTQEIVVESGETG